MSKNYNSRRNTLGELIKSVDFYRVLPKELAEPSVTGASSKI